MLVVIVSKRQIDLFYFNSSDTYLASDGSVGQFICNPVQVAYQYIDGLKSIAADL